MSSGRRPRSSNTGAHDRLDAAGPARPAGVARVVRARDGRDERDRVLAGRLPSPRGCRGSRGRATYDTPLRKTARRGRPGGERVAHHRDERGIAGARRDEQVRPVVVGLEQELALRADHPHPVADRQVPQQRRERRRPGRAGGRTRSRCRRRRAAPRRPNTAAARSCRRRTRRSSCTGRARRASAPRRSGPRSRPGSRAGPRAARATRCSARPRSR